MKIRFLGAAGQVTGSCYQLDVDGKYILVDCGLFQERDFSYRNWQNFPVPPDQIAYVLLTHVHLDHSGLIPKLVKEGFKGSILLTPASKALFPIVIMDSARVQEEDAAYKKERHESEGRTAPHPEVPLYTVQDAQKCVSLLKEVPYETPTALSDNVQVLFRDAGHILGSAMIEIRVHEGDASKQIVFSGDIGQYNKPILENPAVFETADYVVMECTYGDRSHENREEIDDKLSNVINSTVDAKGNLLIPSFVVERAQDLLYHLNRLSHQGRIPKITTFLDGPMVVEITKIFDEFKQYYDKETLEIFNQGLSPFSPPCLRMAESVEESKAINHFQGSAIIIAGSGMITGGRIKHHLAREISNPASTLLFVGYQAEGTLGRQILNGESPVRLFGQLQTVKIKIENIEGFSAHADMNDLRRWLDNFKSPPKNIFLTHGEKESTSSMQNYVNSKEGWHATAPNYMDEFTL